VEESGQKAKEKAKEAYSDLSSLLNLVNEKSSWPQKILVIDEEKGNISLLVSMLAAENNHIFSVSDSAPPVGKSLNLNPNGHPVRTEKEKELALPANPLFPLASPTGFEPVLPA
jgi:hypothetical protein